MGCKVITAYEKDEKAIELYRKNVDGRIFHCEDIGNINPETLPDADIFAGSFLNASYFSRANRRDMDCFAGIRAVISENRPKIVCFVFPRYLIHKQFFANFREYITDSGYSYAYAGISTVKTTGLPIAETKFYFVASRSSLAQKIEFPAGDLVFTYPIEEIYDEGKADEWYYRVDYNLIQGKVRKILFYVGKMGTMLKRNWLTKIYLMKKMRNQKKIIGKINC